MTSSVGWSEPSIILRTRAYGSTSYIVDILTHTRGLRRGLVRGGALSAQNALWQSGTIVMAHWNARHEENLGFFKAECVRQCAVPVFNIPLSLALLRSACILTAEILAEKEAHPELFSDLTHFLSLVSVAPEPPPVAEYLRWECALLGHVGYGLDLTRCAVTGGGENLNFVSPKTGRAVSEEGAGEWRDRLLPLPHFLYDKSDGSEEEWVIGSRLTSHFLQRAVFDVCHRPLPFARERVDECLQRYCGFGESTGQENEERV